jgi:hypothetical protein
VKAIILAACFGLASCASVPSHCYRGAALVGALAGAGGYVVASETASKERYLETVVTDQGDIIDTTRTRKGGFGYENRGSIAIGSAVIASALELRRCSR